MDQSRWMEQPLLNERKRIAALHPTEVDLLLGQLHRDMPEDEILYLLYTVQEAFFTKDNAVEAYSAVVDPYLGIDGVEQVLAIFMYDKGERRAVDFALRSASPYLPYGLALRLEEIAASRVRLKQAATQTDDASYLHLEQSPVTDLTEQDTIDQYRQGTWEDQFRMLRQLDLQAYPLLREYLVRDYLTGDDVRAQSVFVVQSVLQQLTGHRNLFPVTVHVPAIGLNLVFNSPEELEQELVSRAAQLESFAEAAFLLERMDPFKALLFRSWYQMVHPFDGTDSEEETAKWCDAVDELVEQDFFLEAPPSELSERAQKIYRAVHLLLPEGKLYEQTLVQ